MTEAVSDSKDPKKVAAGRLGAEARWTPETRRVARLDDLLPAERAVVLALIEARRRTTQAV